jgi:hypothetical protein
LKRTPLELPRRETSAMEVELVQIPAASAPIDRELDLELHLRLPDRHLTYRARRINARAAPHAIGRSGRQFSLLYGTASFLADGSFIRHR